MGWDWRLSVASIVEDGVFSTFPGVDRIAVLVDGTVELESSIGSLSWCTEGDMHAFAGEAMFTARLFGGPARFFNVMTRREHAVAEVVVHRKGFSLETSVAEQVSLLVLNGRFRVIGTEGEHWLDAEQGLLSSTLQQGAEVSLSGMSGCLVEVRLNRTIVSPDRGIPPALLHR